MEICIGNKYIWEIEKRISSEKCDEYVKFMNNFGDQLIIALPDFIQKEEKFLMSFLPSKLKKENREYIPIGFYNEITITKSPFPIQKHVDASLNDCFFKLSIYVNELSPESGNTIFEITNEKYEVKHSLGKIFIFDISLPHYGGKIENKEIKYVLGFRIKTKIFS